MPAPELLRGLVDDAGLFPPTSLSMADALARNVSDRRAGNPMLTHRFLVPTTRLAELLDALPAGQEIELGLIHAGSEDELESALSLAGGLVKHIELKGVDAMDAVPPQLPCCIEPWTLTELNVAIDAAQSAEGRQAATGVKVRCGGITEDLFPTADELAEALDDIAASQLPMKATAGLHSAVRNTNPETGFDHHGFVNLLLAIDEALTGGDIAGVLDERDPGVVGRMAAALPDDRALAVRRVLASYGSCSTSSPPKQAADLGLIT